MKETAKNVFKGIGIFLAVMIAIYAIAGFTGVIDMKFYKYFGQEKANADHEIFKDGKAYTEGMISSLAKYKLEIETEESVTAKKAILEMITMDYANFDANQIENKTLRSFLLDVQNGDTSKYLE